MRRLIIYLTVALLMFAAGISAFALINGLWAFSQKADRQTVSISIEPPTIPPIPNSTVLVASPCGGNYDNPGSDAGSIPPPPPKPVAPISCVLNGKAISLPKPPYPAIARAAHAGGTVTVQVVIDENGNVISAHAVSGHPLLQAVAVAAARSARFSPTKLSGQPVKVSGVITYNFVPS